jgi:hypothetical protein
MSARRPVTRLLGTPMLFGREIREELVAPHPALRLVCCRPDLFELRGERLDGYSSGACLPLCGAR